MKYVIAAYHKEMHMHDGGKWYYARGYQPGESVRLDSRLRLAMRFNSVDEAEQFINENTTTEKWPRVPETPVFCERMFIAHHTVAAIMTEDQAKVLELIDEFR